MTEDNKDVRKDEEDPLNLEEIMGLDGLNAREILEKYKDKIGYDALTDDLFGS